MSPRPRPGPASPDSSTSSVPGQGADLRRARLSMFFGLIAALSGGFYVAGHLVVLLVDPADLFWAMSHPANVAHLIATLLAALLWRIARHVSSQARTLDAIDGAGTFLICATFSVLLLGDHAGHPPQFVVLLATSWTLVARAALVPCRARTTALVGAIGMVPVLAGTYWFSRRTPALLVNVVNTAFWALIAIVTTGVISRIIYGLQKQVRDAMRVGQYTLNEKIGEGGMGVVYRASHALLRRPTAIKLLHAARTSERDLARFEREVQMTARLTHPNTIAIYDFGHTPDGAFYYAMEYLEGITLEELVELDGPQPPARVAHLLAQVCAALDEAHEVGLVHRDIKPANIILTSRGGVPDIVKVLDFGLVKVLSTTGGAETAADAMLAGTPLYMAPEAITTPDAIDRRADLYAVGATAYFLLTGGPPFQATTVVEVCGKHLHEHPVPPSTRAGAPLPERMEALILRCLAKEPQGRAPSAARLAEELASSVDQPWSSQDARRWWQNKGPTVVEGARRRRGGVVGAASGGPKTIAVDVSGRDDA